MCRQNHNYAVDYFAIGIIGFEFMQGKVLFIKFVTMIIRDHIMERRERTSETTSLQNRFKLGSMRYQRGGHSRQLISLIRYAESLLCNTYPSACKGNLLIVWD